jgi:hypothetical protein
MMVADNILQYSPSGGYGTEDLHLLTIPPWRLFLGHYLGIFIAPFELFGYWQVAQALRPAGKWLVLPVFLISGYTLVAGLPFHATVAFEALAMQARQAHPDTADAVLTPLLANFRALQYGLQLFLIIGLAVGAIWFGVAVGFRPTLYPRWMALFNPLFLALAILVVYRALPVVGNLLLPALPNVTFFVFFTISTVLLWHGGHDLGMRSGEVAGEAAP